VKVAFLLLALALFLGGVAAIFGIWVNANHPEHVIGILPWLVVGAVVFFGLASFVFWIAILIECLTKEPSEGNTKLIWFLVIFFLHLLGCLLYVFVRRPERLAQAGR